VNHVQTATIRYPRRQGSVKSAVITCQLPSSEPTQTFAKNMIIWGHKQSAGAKNARISSVYPCSGKGLLIFFAENTCLTKVGGKQWKNKEISQKM